MAKDIRLSAFLVLLEGHVTEGGNADEFYVDEAGVRSIVAPTVRERAELVKRGGLFTEQIRNGPRDENNERTGELQQSEVDVLREFAEECRLDFPCSLDEVKAWAFVVIGVAHDDIDRRYREMTGKPPPRKAGRPPAYTDKHFDLVETFRREDDMSQAEACREVARLYFPDDDPHERGEKLERAYREHRA